MRRPTREKRPFVNGAAGTAGAVGLAAAITALAPSGNFVPIFAYVVCTLGVCACTTLVTIGVLIRLGRGKSGNPEAAGMVEIGLLVGLFIVSPLALTGAFQLLEAVFGVP